jgi:hypothetical protein
MTCREPQRYAFMRHLKFVIMKNVGDWDVVSMLLSFSLELGYSFQKNREIGAGEHVRLFIDLIHYSTFQCDLPSQVNFSQALIRNIFLVRQYF